MDFRSMDKWFCAVIGWSRCLSFLLFKNFSQWLPKKATRQTKHHLQHLEFLKVGDNLAAGLLKEQNDNNQ